MDALGGDFSQIFLVRSRSLLMDLCKDDISPSCFRSAECLRPEEIHYFKGFVFLLLVNEVKCAHLIRSAHNTTLAWEFRFFLWVLISVLENCWIAFKVYPQLFLTADLDKHNHTERTYSYLYYATAQNVHILSMRMLRRRIYFYKVYEHPHRICMPVRVQKYRKGNLML